MSIERMARRVRAWYGLPGEIVIDGDAWHLVKVGSVPLPHPPLVNRRIRRGLAPETRLRLSYWHELGHLQTPPLALAQAIWLWRRKSAMGKRAWLSRLGRLAAALVGHAAGWELAAEGYVMAKDGRDYRRVHRARPTPLRAVVWGGMAGLALLGTVFSVWKGCQR